MNINKWLNQSITFLNEAGIETARLDAELILSKSLECDRSWLHAHGDDDLEQLLLVKGLSYRTLDEAVIRRSKHEPLAYILGNKEFFGRSFIVDSDVLVPRPESETMIELFLDHLKERTFKVENLKIVDVGTGSGNLIITVALELSLALKPQSSIKFLGLDISDNALEVARKNAKNLGANVEFKHFDLMSSELSSHFSLPSSTFVILANLPYVPDNFSVNDDARFEPKTALFSGVDGLNHYRKLFKQLSKITNFSLEITVLTEALLFQHEELERIANSAGFKVTKEKDLIQVFSK